MDLGGCRNGEKFMGFSPGSASELSYPHWLYRLAPFFKNKEEQIK